jgi:cytochrome c-type biogenesis protein CcmE
VRKRYLIGGGLLAVAVGSLIYMSLGSSVSYYLTVSELLDKGSEIYDTNVRVIGKIVDNSIEWDAEDLELRFEVTEGGETLPVVYQGAKPAGFKAGANILVEGKYRPDRTFQASALLMRCPSKYEPEE